MTIGGYMKSIISILIILLFLSPLYAQEELVFTGIPTIKISEGGTSRTPEKLSKSKAIEYKCTITKMDNKYYWTTRENVELIPIAGGAFITFLASNGSGYIRIVDPELKDAVSIMGETEEKFDYVEHLLLGLKTITYYGKSK